MHRQIRVRFSKLVEQILLKGSIYGVSECNNFDISVPKIRAPSAKDDLNMTKIRSKQLVVDPLSLAIMNCLSLFE